MKLFKKYGSLSMQQPKQVWFDAVQANDLEIMRKVFALGAVRIDICDYFGWTALMYAARNNNIAIVSWLLQMGADAAKNHYKVMHKNTFTPAVGSVFQVACSSSSLQVAQLLYARDKVSMHDVQDGLIAALNYHGYEMVQWLMTIGADIEKVYVEGQTIFLLACRRSSLQVVQMLWNSGKFSLDTIDYEGRNALLQTIDLSSASKGFTKRKEHQSAIVFWLIGLGIDVAYKNKQGVSACMIAVQRKNLAVLEMLYATDKINLNDQDNQGRTALMYAHDHEIVQKLISWGIDLSLKNKDQQIALQYFESKVKACRKEYCDDIDKIIALLEQA